MIQIDTIAAQNILMKSSLAKETVKCVEEMAELQKELCKAALKDPSYVNITEEMADVYLTLRIMQMGYGISEDDINEMISYKIGRTLARLEERSQQE